jgi:hypothetical protein
MKTLAMFWCGRGDSNPHALASASPSSWCVCQFRHFREGQGEKNLNTAGFMPPETVPMLYFSCAGAAGAGVAAFGAAGAGIPGAAGAGTAGAAGLAVFENCCSTEFPVDPTVEF